MSFWTENPDLLREGMTFKMNGGEIARLSFKMISGYDDRWYCVIVDGEYAGESGIRYVEEFAERYPDDYMGAPYGSLFDRPEESPQLVPGPPPELFPVPEQAVATTLRGSYGVTRAEARDNLTYEPLRTVTTDDFSTFPTWPQLYG